MIFEFGEFTLDQKRYELRRAGEPLHLEPQVYAVLCHLLEHRDRLVSTKELVEQVWGHRFVTPSTLNSRIKALRQALGDDGTTQRVIETVRGRGFRFRLPVTLGDAPNVITSYADGRQQIRFCQARDGVRLAYATSGHGPPLVKPANWLTHLEYDWNSPVWRHWITELGRTNTLVRCDARGGGLSDHDVADVSFDAWVSDLASVVDAAQIERFPLLGISQGCAVAIAYAARHPERVSALVLYGGYTIGRRFRDSTPQQDIQAALLESMMRVGWGRDNPAFRQIFGTLFVPEGSPEQWQWFADLTATLPVENALRLEHTAHGIDVSEQAAALDVPTLVLHSRHDGMVSFETGRRMAALIPRARFVPLDSKNHVLLETEPAWKVFLEEVRAFLAAPAQMSGFPHASRQ